MIIHSLSLSPAQSVLNSLVINNFPERELHRTYETTPKTIELRTKVRLGVNASWNLGMTMCTGEFFLSLNDDVLCSDSVLRECVAIMEQRPPTLVY